MLKRLFTLSLAATLATFLFSCSQDAASDMGSVETWDLSGVKSGNMVLPNGTVGYANFETNQLTYNYPEGVFYFSYGPNSGFQALEGGCLDCISSCSGCKPKNNGEDIFCTTCDDNGMCHSHNCGQEEIGNGSGLVDLQAGVSIAKEDEFPSRIDQNITASLSVILMYPEAKKQFEEFVNELWGHNPTAKELEQGSQRLIANVFGTPKVVSVPATFDASGLQRAE